MIGGFGHAAATPCRGEKWRARQQWMPKRAASCNGGLKRRRLLYATGSGRKSSCSARQGCRRMLDKAVTPPATLGRRSFRNMALMAGVSKATVQRLWAANDIKPHLSRTFKLSKVLGCDRALP